MFDMDLYRRRLWSRPPQDRDPDHVRESAAAAGGSVSESGSFLEVRDDDGRMVDSIFVEEKQ